MHTTPPSLLEQLRQPADQDATRVAWVRFVRLYTPLLYHWADRLGAHGPDADDLVQNVFTALVQHLPQFQYDPRKKFRAWLWTVTANKWRETLRQRNGAPLDAAQTLPEDLAGPDDAAAVAETEYRRYLVARALRLMQTQFQPAVWRACWELTVLARPAAEVAPQLGMTVGAVYVAKSRVLQRLRQELAGLLD